MGLNTLIQRVFKTNFAASWEDLGKDSQADETYSLTTVKSLTAAVEQLTDFFGMQACERSDRVPDNKDAHTLLLAGQYKGKVLTNFMRFSLMKVVLIMCILFRRGRMFDKR